jgi:hypothetical protein
MIVVLRTHDSCLTEQRSSFDRLLGHASLVCATQLKPQTSRLSQIKTASQLVIKRVGTRTSCKSVTTDLHFPVRNSRQILRVHICTRHVLCTPCEKLLYLPSESKTSLTSLDQNTISLEFPKAVLHLYLKNLTPWL